MDLAGELCKTFESAMAPEGPKHYLDTGYPPLNYIVSDSYQGGIPQGCITEIYGPSQSGKTAIATQLMIAAQKIGGAAVLLDHERSFHPAFAKSMGLNLEAPFFMHLKPDTWEQSNVLGMKFAKMIRESGEFDKDVPIVMVLDSIAAAIPKSVFDKGIDEYTMNDTTALARVTSTTLKSIRPIAEKLNITIIYLNQIRTKPGVVYGDPTTTPGGMATEFYADLRLSIGKKVDREKGEKTQASVNITAKTVKNRHARPFRECSWRLVTPEGGGAFFDTTGSLVDYLTEVGALKKSGAYIEWTDGKKYHRGPLVEVLEKAGAQQQLFDLLPR